MDTLRMLKPTSPTALTVAGGGVGSALAIILVVIMEMFGRQIEPVC